MITLPLEITKDKWQSGINRANRIVEVFSILQEERKNDLLLDCLEKRIPYLDLLDSDLIFKSITNGKKQIRSSRLKIRRDYQSGGAGPWHLTPTLEALHWLKHYIQIYSELKYRSGSEDSSERCERLPILKLTNNNE